MSGTVSMNQRIDKGSETLWSVMRAKLGDAVGTGILK